MSKLWTALRQKFFPARDEPPPRDNNRPRSDLFQRFDYRYPRWSNLYAIQMLATPAVQLGLRYIKAPIFNMHFEAAGQGAAPAWNGQTESGTKGVKGVVESPDADVAEFVAATLNRFWSAGLVEALECVQFGTAAGIPVYKQGDDGKVQYRRLRGVRHTDCLAFVDRQRRVGAIQSSRQGGFTYKSPRCFWLPLEPEFGSLYGTPRTLGGFHPWWLLTMPNGAIDAMCKWYFKCSAHAGIIRHPDGSIKENDGTQTFYRDVARQIVEYGQAMAVFTLPSRKNDKGDYDWSFEPAKINGSGREYLELVENLKKQIWEGMGIPPEVIQAGEQGGFAGRRVPQAAFYQSLESLRDSVVVAVQQYILDWLVLANFGRPVEYDIVCDPLSPADSQQGPMPPGGTPAPLPPPPPSNGSTSGEPPIELGFKYTTQSGTTAYARSFADVPEYARGSATKTGVIVDTAHAVGSAAKAVAATVGKAEHAVSGAIEQGLAKLPPSVQSAVKGAWSASMATYTAGRKAAEAAAKAAGADEQTVQRIGRTVACIDLLSAKGVVVGLTAAGAGAGIASAAAFVVPAASVAFLGITTARHPIRAYRAAKEAAGSFAAKLRNLRTPAAVAEAAAKSGDADGFMAGVCAAVDAATAARKEPARFGFRYKNSRGVNAYAPTLNEVPEYARGAAVEVSQKHAGTENERHERERDTNWLEARTFKRLEALGDLDELEANVDDAVDSEDSDRLREWGVAVSGASAAIDRWAERHPSHDVMAEFQGHAQDVRYFADVLKDAAADIEAGKPVNRKALDSALSNFEDAVADVRKGWGRDDDEERDDPSADFKLSPEARKKKIAAHTDANIAEAKKRLRANDPEYQKIAEQYDKEGKLSPDQLAVVRSKVRAELEKVNAERPHRFGFKYTSRSGKASYAPTIEEVPQYARGSAVKVEAKKGADETTADKPKRSPEQAAEEYKRLGTKAPAFKEWFGDWEKDPENASKVVGKNGEPAPQHPLHKKSKVTDESGRPKAVFHGTRKDFDAFSKEKIGSNLDTGDWGRGFYFGNEKLANLYARGVEATPDPNAKTIAVYLNIKNPFVIRGDRDSETLTDNPDHHALPALRKMFGEEEVASWKGRHYTDLADIVRGAIGSEKFTETLKAHGFDGVYRDFGDGHYEWIAFEPNQIKAVDNAGTFDPNDNRMRFGLFDPIPQPAPPDDIATVEPLEEIIDAALKADPVAAEAIKRDLLELLPAIQHADAEMQTAAILEVLRRHAPLIEFELEAPIKAALYIGVEKAAKGLPVSLQRRLAAAHGEPPVPPAEAPPSAPEGEPEPVRFPQIESAAKSLRERGVVSKDDFDKLDAEAKRRAFTLAEQSIQTTTEKIRDSLAELVAEGPSLQRFDEKLDAILTTGDTVMSPAYRELVYRNAVMTAYSEGQEAVLDHPMVADEFPFVVHSTVDDDRRTEMCSWLATNGIDGSNVYWRDDPAMKRFKTPVHHQCRCSRRPLSTELAAANGVKDAQEWLATGKPPANPYRAPEMPANLYAKTFAGQSPGLVQFSLAYTGRTGKTEYAATLEEVPDYAKGTARQTKQRSASQSTTMQTPVAKPPSKPWIKPAKRKRPIRMSLSVRFNDPSKSFMPLATMEDWSAIRKWVSGFMQNQFPQIAHFAAYGRSHDLFELRQDAARATTNRTSISRENAAILRRLIEAIDAAVGKGATEATVDELWANCGKKVMA